MRSFKFTEIVRLMFYSGSIPGIPVASYSNSGFWAPNWYLIIRCDNNSTDFVYQRTTTTARCSCNCKSTGVVSDWSE